MNIFDDDYVESKIPIPDDYEFDIHLPIEDGKEPAVKSSFDLDELDSVLEKLTTVDLSKTAYIICEKKNFRSDSLYTAMSDEYKTVLFCSNTDIMSDFEEALCFVIDVTSTGTNRTFMKLFSHVQNCALKQNVPIFLIGEPEDLASSAHMFNENAVRVVKFPRPINLKEVIAEIGTTLTTAPLVEKKKHILVVDDSLTFLKLIQKTLEKKYRVTVTTSALTCIKAITSIQESDGYIDLIVIDYLMEPVDGLSLVKMLRDDPFTKDTPVIFYSGNGNPSEIIKIMPYGVKDFVLKSEPIASLEKCLERIFAERDEQKL